MQDASAFWDKIAAKYAASPIKNMDAYRHTMDRTRHWLSAGDQVLEVGCGTGSTALLLASNVRHMTGSDISAKMLEIARAKAADQSAANVDFVRASIDSDSLPHGPFDKILAFSVLHLVDDLPAALRAIHARLGPGGMFISKSPCLAGAFALLRPAIPIMHLFGMAPRRVRFMSAASLESAVAGAGFEIVESGFHPVKAPTRFVVARRI